MYYLSHERILSKTKELRKNVTPVYIKNIFCLITLYKEVLYKEWKIRIVSRDKLSKEVYSDLQRMLTFQK